MFIAFSANRHRAKCLRFAPCEDSRTVCSWQEIQFAPNRANFIEFSAVKTNTIVQNRRTQVLRNQIGKIIAHSLPAFWKIFFEHFHNLTFVSAHLVLRFNLIFDTINLLNLLEFHQFCQFPLQICIGFNFWNFPFRWLDFIHQIHLQLANLFNHLVSDFNGLQKFIFRHAIGFAFDHHNGIHVSCESDIYLAFRHLRNSWIDDKFAINHPNIHCTNRSIEWYWRNAQCG